jgi:hypothetical protein
MKRTLGLDGDDSAAWRVPAVQRPSRRLWKILFMVGLVDVFFGWITQ